ncbi:MAG: RNA-binding transcriptional accessory protein [Myxococcales bacterium]|nr:RNA-binding transcriptional accessory protein [Myxococcales bacterium]
MGFEPAAIIAEELSLGRAQVETTLQLLGDSATVPFIARYRKEMTGGLDEVAVAKIQERGEYLCDLAARRETVLASIAEQGKLTPSLKAAIEATRSKTELEDLYLPYKPKRKTRATVARERGLAPLADRILAQERGLPPRGALAAPYLGGEVPDVDAAFAGARDIVAERVAETASVRATLRDLSLATGQVAARVAKGKETEGAKYKDYFEYLQPAREIPSHRMLALRRGENEGCLRVALVVDRDACLDCARHLIVKDPAASLAAELQAALGDAYDRLLKPAIEVDVRLHLKELADREAIRVFSDNLRNLLLSPALGGKRVLALDPGFRTGCKLAVIDEQGGLLHHDVVFLGQSAARETEAAQKIAEQVARRKIEAIAVGNGTGGRESETFLRKLHSAGQLGDAQIIVVNESGASVYSASEVAREEFPNEDITVRGAVSIGRRLQDPLAELVKIDPKSIGVGQYQHDVHQPSLSKALDGVVESCVNQVGVDVNTASVKLLSYVAGVGESLAKSIVAHRTAKGPFTRRDHLKLVPRLGPKAFEQAAGFLRVRGGDHPLDNSAVHPESYDIVERMAKDLGVAVAGLVGHRDLVKRINPAAYVDGKRGEPTLRDILAELEKPGRDPRARFEAVKFRADVTKFEDLAPEMVLEGVITNVTQFGAFVDVGVHQDGLVHVSELAHKFVKDPASVVKVGDRVKVKVLQVDAARRRIGLSIKQASEPPARPAGPPAAAPAALPPRRGPRPSPPPPPRNQDTPFNGIKKRTR